MYVKNRGKESKEYTKTTSFLLPMINVNKVNLIRYGLENCYLGDHEHPEGIIWEKHLYIVFQPELYDKEFIDYCDSLRYHENYEEDYDTNDNKVVYVFKLPEKYHNSFEYFKEGKY